MKTWVFTVLLFLPSFCFAQQNEIEAITATVNLYFEGMIQRDRAKLELAFHPEARLIGYRGENFTITPFDTWASGTAQGEPRDPSQYKNSIKAIRVEGLLLW